MRCQQNSLMLGHRCWQHWQLNSHSFVFWGYNCICASLHLFKLTSFLTSCAIVNPKNENNHCSIAVIATLHYNDDHWELQDVIGTKTMSQQRQLNSYSFVLGNAEDVSVFVEGGIKDMVSNALVKLYPQRPRE